jgi:2-aminoadipate transaminase
MSPSAVPGPRVIPWARNTEFLVGSIIDSSTSLLQRQSHDIISFAMGSPADEAVPTELFDSLLSRAVERSGASAFGYAATEGHPLLHTALLDFLSTTPEKTTAERLLITTGGMQGLDLAAKLFVDRGDLVVVESPTYTNGSATMLAYGAEILEVPIDENGMIVELLPELIAKAGRIPKAIYVIPNFQNPSGTALSLERRKLLLELAREWGAVIIDDDPYGMLRFEGEDIPGFRELGEGDPLVFSVRTFSKMLAPGLRVGWVDADPEIVLKMIDAKQTMDTCTNVPAQLLAAEFLNAGHLDSHLVFLREEYRRRKATMQGALQQHFATDATWTDPSGGFFLWLTLPERVDTSHLFEVAVGHGVAFIPGRAFSVSGRFGNALRLCFASSYGDRTIEGVKRLAEAVSLIS